MTQLFRNEAIQHRADRLLGDVALIVPVSWQIIGGMLFLGLVCAMAFLSLAPYSRVETVKGTIVPDRGIAAILPSRVGVVASVTVRDGASVSAGQTLVRIKASEATSAGRSVSGEMAAAVARQDLALAGQTAQMRTAAVAEQARVAAQIAGLAKEIEQIDYQISVQQQLVDTAKTELDNVQEVARRGFISRRDIRIREDSYLNRRQQYSQLQQDRSSKLASREEAQRAGQRASAEAQALTSSLQSSRGALTERLIGAATSGEYLLLSPLDGTVTALTARLGQSVNTESQLMAVVPKRARLKAELYVPTRASGFLKKGQAVRFAVDAFPYQQFGTLEGTIEEISSVPTRLKNENEVTETVYLVVASILRPEISAFGERRRLVPGMILSARIVTRKQSLLVWLFEPLFSVSRR